MRHDLWLLRHGETEWNAAGRLQGHRDSELTARGRAQAEAQHRLLDGIEAVRFASPLGRALTTARIVFGGAPFATDARLSEIDIGDWSGRRLADIRAQRPAAFEGPLLAWYDHAPGGETLDVLQARCASFLADLDGPAIVVTHGVTLRMLRALAIGGSPHEPVGGFGQGDVHLIRAGQASLLR